MVRQRSLPDFDIYDRLGLPKEFAEEELKTTYRRVSREHHPDLGGDEETFKEVQEAYKILSDPDLKAWYDKTRTGESLEGVIASPNTKWGSTTPKAPTKASKKVTPEAAKPKIKVFKTKFWWRNRAPKGYEVVHEFMGDYKLHSFGRKIKRGSSPMELYRESVHQQILKSSEIEGADAVAVGRLIIPRSYSDTDMFYGYWFNVGTKVRVLKQTTMDDAIAN